MEFLNIIHILVRDVFKQIHWFLYCINQYPIEMCKNISLITYDLKAQFYVKLEAVPQVKLYKKHTALSRLSWLSIHVDDINYTLDWQQR